MTVLRHEPVVESMSWASARSLAASSARPLRAAPVPLAEALGCRLAEPLTALVAVPGVDVSAMDGYAVAGAGPWRVAGRVLAGGACHGPALEPGEAVEIATGAPVPAGTSAVLPYEQAAARPVWADPVRVDGPEAMRAGALWVDGPAEAGRHIRRRGEDIAEGAVVLGAGAVVTPVALGLAAALGHDELLVRPRPRVAVLVTGDEVVHEGIPAPGRVRDAIGPFLPGLVEWAGGRMAGTDRLPDGPGALRAALAATAVVDVVVVCGASSKGPADHLRAVLGDLGADVLVDGVAVRPGHPQLLARLPGGPLVVGLPGNPFAALAASLTLLAPILRELAGTAARKEMSALAGPVRTHPRNTRLVPVRRSSRGAVPVGHDRPGSLWGAALAEALAVVPAGWSGEQVELIELPPGG
ncbi:molybdopterin molybdenumtransferase MoeA [Nonomuraea phyllanthi]|uniref:molybdopterin molybdotransferase MoeA n=1 Tax=Nonomuraea phyllanthi TaxID=2219224 RepID=UPI001293AD1C|nr:molybdopterin molybdenumtransferase MoeA [Nonomuraea phyllanthi]